MDTNNAQFTAALHAYSYELTKAYQTYTTTRMDIYLSYKENMARVEEELRAAREKAEASFIENLKEV